MNCAAHDGGPCLELCLLSIFFLLLLDKMLHILTSVLMQVVTFSRNLLQLSTYYINI